MIKVFLTTTETVWDALNYDWIRVGMKYSSVVSCRDGMPLKRHWFDKPNKRWWGLIINGGIDDGVWWPWAPSDWMGSLWIMNEEIPRLISEVVSLSDTQLAFQWGLQHRRQHADNTSPVLQDWSHHCIPTRLWTRCESIQSIHDGEKVVFEHMNKKTVQTII